MDEIIRRHLLSPQNVGELDSADIVITHTNAVCGDSVKIYVKLDNGVIQDIKYKVFGCSTTIAVSSIFSEFLKFKSIMEIEGLEEEKFPLKRGDLEDIKKHAYDLVYEGIMKLINKIKEVKDV